jgi:hypothetical protein
LKIQLAFDHIFSVSLLKDSSQFTGNGKTECVWGIRVLRRNLHKSVDYVCDSRKERIGFLRTPDGKRDTSILENESQRRPQCGGGIGEEHC